jgi:hypothetical protein
MIDTKEIYQYELEQARKMFDFCFADEVKTHEFQIQLSLNKDVVLDGFYSFVEECLYAELLQAYTKSHGVQTTDIMGFITIPKEDSLRSKHTDIIHYQYNRAQDKEGFLALVEQHILKPEYVFENGRQWSSHGKETDKFEHDVKEWLLGVKRLRRNSGTSTIVEVNSAKYYINMAVLIKINTKFNGVIWENIDNHGFFAVFDMNNPIKHSGFIIKNRKMTDFYALLWKMHEFRDNEPQGDFIKPLLVKYGGKAGTFDNIKTSRIDSKMPQSKRLLRDIEECLLKSDM